MRLPMPARSTRSLMALLATSALLGACSDAVAPKSVDTSSTDAESPFVPSAASRALVGVSNGVYTFTIDPTKSQGLLLGANMLYLPAKSICDLETSDYGARYWDARCTPETASVTITATVRNAESMRPRIDFSPAMRFDPKATVSLYMYAPDPLQRTTALTWVMLYCNDRNVCINEALTDPTLVTLVDSRSKIIYRRIKHFSGYILNSGFEDGILP